MNQFCVLLVDDDERNILSSTKKHFEEHPEIALRTANESHDSLTAKTGKPSRSSVIIKPASTYQEATLKIKENYFHLAMIDARLDKNDGNNFAGTALLSDLIENRLSCERILISNLFGDKKNAERLIQEAHPILEDAQGRAHSLFNKGDPSVTCSLVIEDRACRWLKNPVNVKGADLAAEALQIRVREEDNKKPVITVEEVDYLVSRLFGQGQEWNFGDGIGIARVEISMLEQGFSAAAVLKARCYSGNGTPGIWCVLKFADRKYIEQELVRYSRYVRFRLDMNHRVELLGWGIADNIGVLCYNFASNSSDSAPISLSKQFILKDEGFFASLDDLLSPGKKGWYKEQDTVNSLGQFFKKTYNVDTLEVRRRFTQFQELGKISGDDRLTIGNVTLDLPSSKLFTDIAFTEPMEGCIVHGDMHCDNILVGAGNRPNLIDYFFVGNGPRSLDFATLESSIRLLDLKKSYGEKDFKEKGSDPVIPELLNLLQIEEAILSSTWMQKPAVRSKEQPFWVQASIHISRLAQSNHPSLQANEYAATCLMWGMRLLKVRELSTRQRIRILVWISSFVKMLNVT